MKKVIFISALAIAAAVSCTKSDIVDTKFNEQISFETYTGRTAMTKAAETTKANLTAASLYGFYTGEEGWNTSSKANLWNPITLSINNGVVAEFDDDDKRYWANADDMYTFLAYAPIATGAEEGGNGLVVSTTTDEGENPTLTYTVNPDLTKQIDLLYATPVETNKDEVDNAGGKVKLQFNHALSRVTVNAKAAVGPLEFHIKDITLSGAFYTKASFTLKDPTKWNYITTATTEDPAEYNFYNNTAAAGTTAAVALPEDATYKNYASDKVTASNEPNNYLMMIPTTAAAVLTVKYTTYYMNQESQEFTRTFDITGGFEAGKAYAFNLDFAQTSSEILFSVDVTSWVDGTNATITERE